MYTKANSAKMYNKVKEKWSILTEINTLVNGLMIKKMAKEK